jgi:hypothetical protein
MYSNLQILRNKSMNITGTHVNITNFELTSLDNYHATVLDIQY